MDYHVNIFKLSEELPGEPMGYFATGDGQELTEYLAEMDAAVAVRIGMSTCGPDAEYLRVVHKTRPEPS